MSQLVDPFVPVCRPLQRRVVTAGRRPIPGGQYGREWFRPGPTVKPSMGDSRSAPPPAVRRPQRITPPVEARQQAVPASPRHTARRGWLRRPLRRLQVPVVMLAAAAVVLLAQSLVLGEIAISVYTVAAIVRRVSSRTTFAFALLTLVSVLLMLCINRTNALVGHFAIYTFLLLAAGTVSLGIELIRGEA